MIAAERRGTFRPGWHDRLGDAIDTAPITAWEQRLEPHQVAFVERVTANELERFGYRPSPALDAEPDPYEFVRLKRHRRRRLASGAARTATSSSDGCMSRARRLPRSRNVRLGEVSQEP